MLGERRELKRSIREQRSASKEVPALRIPLQEVSKNVVSEKGAAEPTVTIKKRDFENMERIIKQQNQKIQSYKVTLLFKAEAATECQDYSAFLLSEHMPTILKLGG